VEKEEVEDKGKKPISSYLSMNTEVPIEFYYNKSDTTSNISTISNNNPNITAQTNNEFKSLSSNFSKIVELNVGGKYFTTSLETLITREPESMLTKMFSGTWNLRRDSTGRIFIDRDGSLFKHILNYLRDGIERIPTNMMEQLLPEAKFYQLHQLIVAIESLREVNTEKQEIPETFAAAIMVK